MTLPAGLTVFNQSQVANKTLVLGHQNLLYVPMYLQATSLIQMTKMGSTLRCNSIQPSYVAKLPDAADDLCVAVGGAAPSRPAKSRLA